MHLLVAWRSEDVRLAFVLLPLSQPEIAFRAVKHLEDSPGYNRLISKLLLTPSSASLETLTPSESERIQTIPEGKDALGGVDPDLSLGLDQPAHLLPKTNNDDGEEDDKDTDRHNIAPTFVIQEDALRIRKWEAKLAEKLYR